MCLHEDLLMETPKRSETHPIPFKNRYRADVDQIIPERTIHARKRMKENDILKFFMQQDSPFSDQTPRESLGSLVSNGAAFKVN